MKKLLAILVLVLLLSDNANAEWTLITTSVNGNRLYVDKRTIKIVGNIRYFYMMQDYVTPNSYGDLSSKSYRKLNCTNMMFQDLVKDYFRTPLGEGNPTEGSGPIQNPEWKSNPPDSNGAFLNKKVCEM